MNSNEVDILLVDDSQDDVDLTLHALRAENLANRVFVARDGEEALEFLFCSGPHADRSFEHPPKLVLLDLKLPKVDGMQVLKQVKRDERTRTIPVVLMTSSKEERDRDWLQPGCEQLSPETGGLRPVSENGEAPRIVLAGL
jgi:two-component system, response regulator